MYLNINSTKLIFVFFLISFTSTIHAQEAPDTYWTAVSIAEKLYDNAAYEEAAAAYEIAWTKERKEERANHRLHAAVSYCLIDNETKTKENLFKLLGVSTESDMKKVLVNYQLFDRYKQTEWWKELHAKMDTRLEQLIAHHKNLTYFQKGKNLKYTAIRINKNGDTLANTFIHLIPDGTGWGSEAASSQSQVTLRYEYTEQDSLDHIAELDSVVMKKFWLKDDPTGVIENDSILWIHPFRNNEFFKTELAPFPLVHFPISDETVREGKSTISIMSNWGTYSPSKTELNYNYIGQAKRSYGFSGEIECHHFKSAGENSIHGTSTLEYYFNEKYGFTEMIYQTYDEDVIIFEINEVYFTSE